MKYRELKKQVPHTKLKPLKSPSKKRAAIVDHYPNASSSIKGQSRHDPGDYTSDVLAARAQMYKMYKIEEEKFLLQQQLSQYGIEPRRKKPI